MPKSSQQSAGRAPTIGLHPALPRAGADLDGPALASGCAISGRLFALATVKFEDGYLKLSLERSRIFHLGGDQQEHSRTVAAEIYQFVSSARISELTYCRTHTGYLQANLDAEVRAETLLQIVPGLAVHLVDNDAIADWALSADPLPALNAEKWDRGLAPMRAIEVAQCVLMSATERARRAAMPNIGSSLDEHLGTGAHHASCSISSAQ